MPTAADRPLIQMKTRLFIWFMMLAAVMASFIRRPIIMLWQKVLMLHTRSPAMTGPP